MTAKCPEKAAAKAAGKTTYEGRPCSKGHGTLRVVATGGCAECARQTRRAAYYRNPQQRVSAREAMRKLREADPVGVRMRQNASRTLKLYGLTRAQYEALFAQQNGCCAICGIRVISRFDGSVPTWRGRGAPKNNVARIDHCHLTNVVRGLLCSNCNILLGKAKDSIKILLSAVGYLRASATQQAQPTATREVAR